MIDSVVSGPFIPLSLPLPLWTGHLVDRLGPQPVVLVAQLLQAAGFLGYLMVRNTGVLLLAATIDSLGQRAFWSSAFTLVSNLSDRQPGGHSRERWFGIIGSLRAAGYGVGAVVAGVALSEKSGPVYRGAISACAGLLLAAALLLASAVPRKATLPATARLAVPGRCPVGLVGVPDGRSALAAAGFVGPVSRRSRTVLLGGSARAFSGGGRVVRRCRAR